MNLFCKYFIYVKKIYENEYVDRVFLGYVTSHECDESGNFPEDSGKQ